MSSISRCLLLSTAAVVLSGCSLFGSSAPSTPSAGRAAVLELDPQPPVSFRCGQRVASLRHFGELATLSVDGRNWTLRPERTASGMRMVSVDEDDTEIWVKGNAARLRLDGAEQSECRIEGAKPLFRAVGNEPGWRLDIGAQGMELLADGGELRAFAAGPLVIDTPGQRSYQGITAGGELVALVIDGLCQDSMSGMPHPKVVEVRWQDRVLKGCGGDPAELLQGEPWQVNDIDGNRVQDPARLTLAFTVDGRVAGIAACNRYTGSYALSGEGLRLSQLAATRMACAPALMDEEQRFMSAAARVQGFALTANGVLELKAGDRVVMRARRN
jgi:heat shock protein HslJ